MSFWSSLIRTLARDPAVLSETRAELEQARAERDAARALAGVRGDLVDDLSARLERAQQAGREAMDDLNAAIKERDEARAETNAVADHVRRLTTRHDAAARAVRSPHLTDAEKLAEVREALAIVEGQREGGDGPC